MKDDMLKYDGADGMAAVLNYPSKTKKKVPVDWDSFMISSERGKM